jgi:hypothetical protein
LIRAQRKGAAVRTPQGRGIKRAAVSAAPSGRFTAGRLESDLHRLGNFGGVVFHHLLDAFADDQQLEAATSAPAALTTCSTVVSPST